MTDQPRIFDAHAHVLPVGPNSSREAFELIPYGLGGVEGTDLQAEDLRFRLNVMDRSGFRAAVVMASNVYERPQGVRDTERQNDYVAWYRDNHRDRFPVALGTIEPNHGIDAGLAELHRMKEELRLDGVVWHHMFSGSTIDEPRMVRFVQELAALDMPACIHLNGGGTLESASHFGELAMKVPEATLVGLGAFSSHRNMHDLRAVGRNSPNAFFETSLAWPMGQPILEYAELFGSERLLFGTDMHFNPKRLWIHPTGLSDILQSERLTDVDRHNILWGNAERLFPRLKDVE